LLIWLHGIAQDEHSFVEYAVDRLDAAIACGKLPAPDRRRPGWQLEGEACFYQPAASSLNTKAGASKTSSCGRLELPDGEVSQRPSGKRTCWQGRVDGRRRGLRPG